MHYHAKLEREGRKWNAVFVDAPGCATFASSRAKVLAAAKEALEGWLEAHLLDGRAPPKPAPSARGAERIEIDPQLAVAVALRWARQAAGLTQTQLASRIGVSQQQVAKLERPGANPSIATLRKVADALGVRVRLELVA
ncbi:MAG TPA: type II toxin-antitoxin system HicB family antitoxin [Polyangiaceae bacterium]|jgi:predicted RNase H-like HicB family nuclease/DNA-binding Xre family transcriptional regulator|nr:type II toxin-antitoxin system HicB family antitoxin [Polyangiaceae bacterium]